MPAYDFRCNDCSTVFEVVRPASDASAVCCPECGGPAKRLFSAPGVVFKGSGFHSTDYRAKKDDATPSGACPSAKEGSSACSNCPAASGD